MAVKGNKEIEFTFTEFEIFLRLAQNAGMVFSKEKIYNIVWKEPYFGDYNIVMSHIRNLRGKIEDKLIFNNVLELNQFDFSKD